MLKFRSHLGSTFSGNEAYSLLRNRTHNQLGTSNDSVIDYFFCPNNWQTRTARRNLAPFARPGSAEAGKVTHFDHFPMMLQVLASVCTLSLITNRASPTGWEPADADLFALRVEERLEQSVEGHSGDAGTRITAISGIVRETAMAVTYTSATQRRARGIMKPNSLKKLEKAASSLQRSR